MITALPYLLDLLAHLLRTLKDARGLALDQVGMDEEHMPALHPQGVSPLGSCCFAATKARRERGKRCACGAF
ncbi:MAG: hypothetical protein ACYC2E_08280 [Sulfuricella sp.]